MNTAAQTLVILTAGLASQWIAWRIGLPAIVILIASGLILGPISGVIDFDMSQAELSGVIGLGVAIVLFEGGMDLKLAEFRRVGHGVGRLTILGPPLAWLFGSLAAHYVGGLDWPVSTVLGAILVVTGPTVILPLLRQARLDKEAASLLKWEGIVNDPTGVLLAVLTFQYVVNASGLLYRRGAAPEHLKAPLLTTLVLGVFWLSNLVQHEAGLLSVTLMGLVIGNMHLVERETLQRFKEHLTVVLLSVLFVVIPSQINGDQLALMDWRAAAFVLVVLLLVRPLTIALATLGAPMRRSDKLLLAWIAPRGIVAAATAGIFGPELVAAGYPDAAKLLPITFAVIIVTVLVHGLSIGPVARRLGLAAKSGNGLLIVGGSPWALAFAQLLKKLGIGVLIVDGVYQHLKRARMAGITVYHGEILSEHTEHTLETQHLSHVLCATDNDFYNALACKALGRRFGHHRSFQLATQETAIEEFKRITPQQRGYFAFGADSSFDKMHERLESGWMVQSTKMTSNFGWDELKERLGEPRQDWMLLGGIDPAGALRIYSKEQSFKLESGWSALYFAPKRVQDGEREAAAREPA